MASIFEPLGIAWVGLFAESLPTLTAFYKNLGFQVLAADDNYCLMDAGSGSQFEIWSKGAARSMRKTPSEQSVLVGFRVARLEPVVSDWMERGVMPIGAIESDGGTRWIHYVDPEGNRFELKDLRGEGQESQRPA